MSTNTTRTGQPSQRRLLDEIVDALIRHHNIVKDDLTYEFQGETIPWNPGWKGGIEQIALAKAKTLSAETLARIIVAEPNAALYNVHCGTWLGKYREVRREVLHITPDRPSRLIHVPPRCPRF